LLPVASATVLLAPSRAMAARRSSLEAIFLLLFLFGFFYKQPEGVARVRMQLCLSPWQHAPPRQLGCFLFASVLQLASRSQNPEQGCVGFQHHVAQLPGEFLFEFPHPTVKRASF
jgi:hypothetical protein